MKKIVHKFLSILLTIAMVIAIVPQFSVVINATIADTDTDVTVGDYTIVIPKGVEIPETAGVTPIEITSEYSPAEWNSGWYVVIGEGVEIENTVTVNGNVNLILTDGATLTVYGKDGNELSPTGQKAIKIESGATLTVYGGTDDSAGIMEFVGGDGWYGGDGGNGIECSGTITVNGGIVDVYSGDGGDISDGSDGGDSGVGIDCSGTITVNRGSLYVDGGHGGGFVPDDSGEGRNGGNGNTGIRCSGTIAVNGGILEVYGGHGGGFESDDSDKGRNGGDGGEGIECSGTITVNGGSLSVNGGIAGGGGDDGDDGNGGDGICGSGTITINGGHVEVYGGAGGYGGDGINLTGSITAEGESVLVNGGILVAWSGYSYGGEDGEAIVNKFRADFTNCSPLAVYDSCEDLLNDSDTEYSGTSDSEQISIMQKEISYLTYNDGEFEDATVGGIEGENYTQIKDDKTSPQTWNAGWYVVTGDDVQYSDTITINGDVHLILKDGASLTVTAEEKAGITFPESGENSLTIYGQDEGTGVLVANGGSDMGQGSAGIGASGMTNANGNIIINGGTITANGCDGDDGNSGGAGIGGGGLYDLTGDITINGGIITATGGRGGNTNSDEVHDAESGGAGIGTGGTGYLYGDIIINGGNITARGGDGGNGGEYQEDEEDPVYSGGGNAGSGIGNGGCNTSWDVNINGGNIEAVGGNGGNGVTGKTSDGSNASGISAGSDKTVTVDTSLSVMQGDNAADTAVENTGEDLKSALTKKYVTITTPQEQVDFLDYNNSTGQFEDNYVGGLDGESYTEVTDSDDAVEWTAGYYVVNDDVLIYGSITVSGDVKLILMDDVSLTADEGIIFDQGTEPNILTIFSQSTDDCMGRLYAYGSDDDGGIGIGGYGSIVINGGEISAQGGDENNEGGIGICAYYQEHSGGNITINGGDISAEGGDAEEDYESVGGVGIYADKRIIISGGAIEASGGYGEEYGDGISVEDQATIQISENLIVKAGEDFYPETIVTDSDSDNDYADEEDFLVRCVTIEPPEEIPYLNWNGSGFESAVCTKYTMLNSSDMPTTWSDGWYVVGEDENVDYTEDEETATITVSGDVHLILADNSVLTIKGDPGDGECDHGYAGISLADGASLTIYAQSTGDDKGKLIVNGGNPNGDVPVEANGGSGISGIKASIIINGGDISATGADSSVGDSGAGVGIQGRTVTVNGGKVTATGGSGTTWSASGLEAGDEYNQGVITINGGTVTAAGGNNASGINAHDGSLTVSGGIVDAAGSKGIDSGTLTVINGGSITATGSDEAISGTLNDQSLLKIRAGEDEASAEDVDEYDSQKYVCIKAPQAEVAYQNWNGTAFVTATLGGISGSEYTIINNDYDSDTFGADDTTSYYVVKDNGIELDSITVNGDVKLILCDGCNLNIEGYTGMDISENASLTVYGQSTDSEVMGVLNILGGSYFGVNSQTEKTFTICGGSVNISACEDGGEGFHGPDTPVAVYGGELICGSDDGYTGIKAKSLTVVGGCVKSEESEYENAIDISGDIIISGGEVSAESGEECNGISAAGTITITGGEVCAMGGDKALSANALILTNMEIIGADETYTAGETTYLTNESEDDYVIITPAIANGTPETSKTTNNGYIELSVNSSTFVGDTVTVSVTPSEGYVLDKVTIKKTADSSDVTTAVGYSSTEGTFTKPYYPVTVSASFNAVHSHSWNYALGTTTTENDTITATCTTDDSTCGYQTTPDTLTIVKPQLTTYGAAGKSANASFKDGKTTIGGITVSTSGIMYEGVSPTSYEKSSTAPTAVGTYKASITAGDKTAYVEYTIAKADITPDVSITGWTYGDQENSPSVTGNSGSGTVSYTYKLSTEDDSTYSQTVPTSAGTYLVKASIAETDNYNSGSSTAAFTIAKKAVTVGGIDAVDKTYDGTTAAALDYTNLVISGLVEGETLTATAAAAFADKNAGNGKTVSISDITLADKEGKDFLKNYTLAPSGSQTSTKASITAKDITVTITANGGTYGGTITPAAAEFEGLAAGDSVSPVLSYSGNANDGTSVSGENAPSKAGSFTVTASLPSGSSNYNLTGTKTASFVVSKAAVTAPTISSKTYTGSTLTADVNCTDKPYSVKTNNGGILVGKYDVVLSLTDTNNYKWSDSEEKDKTVEFQISKVANSWTKDPNIEDVSYGSAISTEGAAKFGSVSITYEGTGSTSYSSSEAPTNAGTYKATFYVAATNEYGNLSTDVAFTIAKKTVSVGGITADEKIYDGNTAAVLTYSGIVISGLVGQDTLTATATGTFDDKNVGNGKTVSISNITLADKEGKDCLKNYILSSSGNQTSTVADITKKSITAKWTAVSKVYTGSDLTPSAELFGVCQGDSVNVTFDADNKKTSAGSYQLKAELDNTNYTLTNPYVNFIIEKAPVTITVTNDSYEYDGSVKSAALTASPDVSMTVVYKNSNGEELANPTEKGNYGIYVTLDENHRFAGFSDGKERKVGTLSIYQGSAPAAYTVSFNGGVGAEGTTEALSAVKSGEKQILPSCSFVKSGWTFTGWKYENKLYKEGDSFTQPSKSVILTAEWTQNVYTIDGCVKDCNDEALENAVVTLMSGARKVEQKITDEEGKYSFTEVVPGLYNLVTSYDGITETTAVKITNESVSNLLVDLPEGRTNSVVEVTPGTPEVIVDGLEESFTVSSDGNYKEADKAVVDDGGSVEFKLTVSENSSPDLEKQEELSKKSSGDFVYLDMNLVKTVLDKDGVKDTEKSGNIYTSDKLLEIIVPIPTELQGKDSYQIYRYHTPDGTSANESLTQMKQLSDKDTSLEEGYRVSSDKKTITVYTKSFSLYAIGYTESSVSSINASIYSVNVTDTVNGSVIPSARFVIEGNTIALTVYAKEGYKLGTLNVTDENGNVLSLKDNMFVMPKSDVYVSAVFVKDNCAQDNTCVYAKFTDTDTNGWYHDGVHFCVENGYMNGVSKKKFAPNENISRAMIVTILWNIEGNPSSDYEMSFKDVPKSKWYTEAVRWAQSTGIVTGYDETSFGPDDYASREQLAVILYRYAKYKGYSTENTSSLEVFTDRDMISSWALESVKWAKGAGIINGRTSNTIVPNDFASRAEAACMVQRLCEYVFK